ncbi:TlpA family protein disulfide reductase [Pedobacter hiemivivus]|uniref:AhpC/TSA family protein n=1 Tax=Pedobacter hiemivivus TaxID=2530454 RepID=A0A4R0NC28_9SPHI|nr:TlpA disulfide reductase family protein [Pedobacter hiemivivus]TCC97788.1 AhpC/TSA family protein [Pedobacter hiemivivus]
MMKILLSILGLLCFGLVSSAQTDSITISGTLRGLNSNKISISWIGNDAKNRFVSIQGKGDHFSARVPLQHTPIPARLYISGSQESRSGSQMPVPPFNFFLLDKDITLNGDATVLSETKVKGDLQNEHYNDLLQQTAKAERRYTQLLTQLTDTAIKKSPADSVELHQEIRATIHEKTKTEKAFISANPDAFASVFLLSRLSNSYGADEYISAWDALRATYKGTTAGLAVGKIVEKLSITKFGTKVFAFERVDKDGHKISTEALKGRTYILDFWGSWCGPCRASHPHLKELYKKYKSKGFEIVAIAQERGKTLEESRTSWSKAIQEDGINWIHILNQDGIEKQNIVKTFNVNAFPTKILVGADGRIITRTTSSASDAIDKALEKIYGF